MALTLGLNISSLKTQRELARSTSDLSNVFEKLSSGQRINRASDDAAGLAIADSLRADARVYNQAMRNLNDGISILSIADATLNELSGIATRVQELAEQSANGVYSREQRMALDNEAKALRSEYRRVVESAEFNGRRIFRSDDAATSLQAGYGTDSILNISGSNSVFFDAGNGTFADAVTVDATGGDRGLNIADFDNDGDLDFREGRKVYHNNGDGTFTFIENLTNSSMRSSNAIDVNNDGFVDLIEGSDTNASVYVRINNGDGTFATAITYAPGGTFNVARFVGVGDVDGDGDVDIFTSDQSSNTYVLFNQGDGTFDSGVSVSAYSPTQERTIVDLNNDGYGDLYTGGTSQLSNGDGTFQSTYVPFAANSKSEPFADVNNDSNVDFVGFEGGYMAVYTGNGDGTFTLSATMSVAAADPNDTIGLIDSNLDGNLDIMYVDDSAGQFYYFAGNGNGSFSDPVTSTLAASINLAAFGDLNGDGVADMLTSQFGGATFFYAGNAVPTAGFKPVDLTTAGGARAALDYMTELQSNLTSDRGNIGAGQARINVALNVLQVTSENFTAAESRIRDADIATTSAELARLQILQQAASSVLGQANQIPSLALNLLGV